MRRLHFTPDEEPSTRERRPLFPVRTLILMAVALATFAWMWWRTHELGAAAKAGKPVRARSIVLDLDPVLVPAPGGDR